MQNKLGRLDPDEVFTHVACGGSLQDMAKQLEMRFSDLYKYITSVPDGEKKYELALKTAEARDKDLIIRSLRGVIETYPSDMFNEDGSVKPVSEWPKELIAGFEIEEIYNKSEAVGNIKKVKAVDRLRAMEMLGKERGMFANRTKLETTLTLEQLVEQSNSKGVIDVGEERGANGVHEGERRVSELSAGTDKS